MSCDRVGHSTGPRPLAVRWTAGVAAMCWLLAAAPGMAGTIDVNGTGDQIDANTTDGTCDADLVTMGPQCTLRAAIREANARSGEDTIVVGEHTYTLSLTGTGRVHQHRLEE